MNKKLSGFTTKTKIKNAISTLSKASKYITSDAELVRMKETGRK